MQTKENNLPPRPYKVLLSLIGLMPLSIARCLGATLAKLAWLCKEHNSRITIQNIARCYPALDKHAQMQLAKRSVVETGKLALEIILVHQRSAAWLDKRIHKIAGEDLIIQAMNKKKGLILLVPHLGNWEVMGLKAPSYGPMTSLYQPPKQNQFEEIVRQAREKTGASLVPTTRQGIAKLMASLREGGITGILPDQNPKQGSGIFSPFFQHATYTMTTIHAFLRRLDSVVLMGFAKRVPGGFELHFQAPPEEIYSSSQEKSVAALNQAVEQCIAHCPEQYQWEYKRFKIRPDGEGKFY